MPRLRILGGTFLIAGTAIGAGMLALPVVTALGGFFPACILYLICWIFSAATGLLFLEICLWMPQDANIVSMASHLLGKWGKVAAWILYLFLFYSLSIAYIAGGGGIFYDFFQGNISYVVSTFLFTLIFGMVVYLGARVVDRCNALLMCGLVVTYVAFVLLGIGKIDYSQLLRVRFAPSLLALPVIFTSFSYQGVIPSLHAHLNRQANTMRLVILLGTAIPFVIYVIWEMVILGLVPLEGPHGLLQTQRLGQTAVAPLKHLLSYKGIYGLSQFFGVFALTTSFLGVTLGLFDFLSDALQISKRGFSKGILAMLTYLPPLGIAISYPGIFLKTLNVAGGIGAVLLLGLMPVLMVWQGRYRLGYPKLVCQLKGGKPVLIILILFIVFELGIEIAAYQRHY